MTTPAFCSVCGQPPPADAAFCPSCRAVFDDGRSHGPDHPHRRRSSWRTTHASSASPGMLLGFIAVCVVSWMFLGLFVAIAALVVLGLLWVLRLMFGSAPVSPGVAKKRAERDRHRRGATLVAARKPQERTPPT